MEVIRISIVATGNKRMPFKTQMGINDFALPFIPEKIRDNIYKAMCGEELQHGIEKLLMAITGSKEIVSVNLDGLRREGK